MSEKAALEVDVRRPFLRADALAAGITPKQLRGPRYLRLFTNVYVGASAEPRPIERVQAALLLHPRREGIRNHVVGTDTPMVRYRGLRLSSPAHCFVELAGQLTLVDLVVVGDHLVRRGLTTPEELVGHAGRRGTTAAVRAAACVRRGADSPMETRLRMLIVLAGLPEPTVNHTLRHEDGRVRYRFDLSWPELRIVVEYDGRQHRADLDQWVHDVERSEWLDDQGWLHVPVFSRGIYRRPDRTLERVVKALRSRGGREVPPRLSDAWRPHFPVVGG